MLYNPGPQRPIQGTDNKVKKLLIMVANRVEVVGSTNWEIGGARVSSKPWYQVLMSVWFPEGLVGRIVSLSWS